jgi:hypothetical protein
LQAEAAAKNLKFFVDIGYLEDPTGQIRDYAGRGEAPKILTERLQYGVSPGTCKQGFVWRVARPTDLVCVPPDVRDTVRTENAQAALRVISGSDTCVSDFVWREAFPGDRVCVTPERRGEDTQEENALGPIRTIVTD